MKQREQKHSCLWLVLLFGIFIGVFTVWDLLTPAKNFSEFENRYLKQRPTFSWGGLMDNSYTQSYESFINDQFVLRNQWIDLKSKTETGLLKVENNGIVYGREDMMFEKYQSFDSEQLQKNLGFLEEFAQGKENLTFVVIPSAYEIYPENLPYGLLQVNQKSEIEAIYDRLGAHMQTIDLYPTLTEHKDNDIYYRTDHHWTTDGAYLAYVQYCATKRLNPVNIGSLSRKEVEGFYGTYFNKSKNTSAKPDTLTYFEIPMESVNIDGVEKDGYLDTLQFEGRDKYAAFLYGNNGVTVLQSGNNQDHQDGKISRILLIKDSFSNCFAPFLTYNYDEVYVVDLRSFPKGMTELVENTAFDDILIMYNFMNLESDTNLYRLKY